MNETIRAWIYTDKNDKKKRMAIDTDLDSAAGIIEAAVSNDCKINYMDLSIPVNDSSARTVRAYDVFVDSRDYNNISKGRRKSGYIRW